MAGNSREQKFVSNVEDTVDVSDRKAWTTPKVIVSSIARETTKTTHVTFESHGTATTNVS